MFSNFSQKTVLDLLDLLDLLDEVLESFCHHFDFPSQRPHFQCVHRILNTKTQRHKGAIQAV